MIVKVKYLDEKLRCYKGTEYTYRTELPLEVYDKVLAPVKNDDTVIDKKAIVSAVNLPEDTIKPEWAAAVKNIVAYDD